jgi:hypothetical protein
LSAFNGAELREELLQICTADVEAQISDIQSLTHCRTPYVLSKMPRRRTGHFAKSTPTQSMSFLGRMKAADVAACQVARRGQTSGAIVKEAGAAVASSNQLALSIADCRTKDSTKLTKIDYSHPQQVCRPTLTPQAYAWKAAV